MVYLNGKFMFKMNYTTIHYYSHFHFKQFHDVFMDFYKFSRKAIVANHRTILLYAAYARITNCSPRQVTLLQKQLIYVHNKYFFEDK